jgi:hypothetical protein
MKCSTALSIALVVLPTISFAQKMEPFEITASPTPGLETMLRIYGAANIHVDDKWESPSIEHLPPEGRAINPGDER